MKPRSQYHGFTLVELMVSMGLIAILLAVAVPSVKHMVKDNRLVTQLNAVINDIHFARSEAVKRDTRVILCRSLDPNHATPVCNGDPGDWSNGYLVFASGDTNSTYQSGTDTLMRRGQPSQQGVDLIVSATWSTDLQINPTGVLNEANAAVMAICDDRGKEYGRQITIPLSGIPRMYSNNIADCSP